MNPIDYSDTQYTVRPNLAESQNYYWEMLASPGTWLSGAQRIAVAKEIRQAHSCSLCQQRKTALSPYQVDGAHDTASSEIPDTMVEMVHRIVSDPARLTKKWFDGLMQQGLTPEEYVEVLGVLVHTFTVDEFCRGLGFPLNDLPQAKSGEPTQYRPENASYDAGAWVPLLPNTIDSGPESDLWPGQSGNVVRALSLVPDEVRNLMAMLPAHYLKLDTIFNWEDSPNGGLTRMQTEVVAARVASHTDCFY